ncbi:MAG: C-GCAxxG-C-C family protein [Candidatus Cryptobacteroides sp.]
MEDYIEKKAAEAESLFRSGYNCAQSVALAFADYVAGKTGLDEDAVRTMLTCGCAGFGGGFGRMREVCGCVSGMTAIAGFICPAGRANDAASNALKAGNYALVQKLAGKFKDANGSIVCRELLAGTCAASTDSRPSDRTAEYYKKRPCPALAAFAAECVAEEICSRECQ